LHQKHCLRFLAGPKALALLQKDGFRADCIGAIAGASGGPKWLILSQLDRVIIERVLPQLRAPVHLVGSSIGAWRFACYAQRDPLAALQRFEDAYLEQTYSDKPDMQEIADVTQNVLETVLAESGSEEILTHPVLRAQILAVRSRLSTRSDHKVLLASGLAIAAAANVVSRQSLGLFFRRSMFYDPRTTPPFFGSEEFPADRVALTPENLPAVIRASGAIPMVLPGVHNIDGAPRGVYRDGGIIDYHLDLTMSNDDQITLFPHFFDRLTPGWFDKRLSWRTPRADNLANMLLISPSQEFVASLPRRKIPDRSDFVELSAGERVRVWREVVSACTQLADEFADVIEQGRLPARVEAM